MGTFTVGAVRGLFRGDFLRRWNRLEMPRSGTPQVLLATVRWQYGRLVAPLLTDGLIGGSVVRVWCVLARLKGAAHVPFCGIAQ